MITSPYKMPNKFQSSLFVYKLSAWCTCRTCLENVWRVGVTDEVVHLLILSWPISKRKKKKEATFRSTCYMPGLQQHLANMILLSFWSLPWNYILNQPLLTTCPAHILVQAITVSILDHYKGLLTESPDSVLVSYLPPSPQSSLNTAARWYIL